MTRLLAAWVMVCAAQAQITVDEGATRASLVHERTSVSLALRNASSGTAAARIRLEWVDTRGAIQGSADLRYTAPPGESAAEAPLPLDPNSRDVLFYRLHDSVTSADSPVAFPPQEGMVSLWNIAAHAFRLSVTALGTARTGRPVEYRVLATHPLTGAPVPGVAIRAEDSSTKTDAHGVAVLRETPKPADWDGGDLEVKGRLGDLHQAIRFSRPPIDSGEIRVSTDKPLYQPGQTLHLRFLALASGGAARARGEYSVTIRDPRYQQVFRKDVTTSRFGIAAADWEVPESAPSGSYHIQVEDAEGDARADSAVEVRHYDLPGFRVAARADRPFYLPGQNAVIDLRADYLFGKPLTAGKVRITTSGGEEALIEGALDSAGQFHGTLDLSQTELGERELFRDLHYTAYVTEPGANRTEQRRFDVRVSREPIHVYVLTRSRTTLGDTIYVSTYDAGGTPAACDLEVVRNGRGVLRARANRLGIARIDLPPDLDSAAIVATAGALRGSAAIDPRDADAHVRLETGRSLYRPGEPVRYRVESDRRDLHVTLVAWGEDGAVRYSRSAALRDGRIEGAIPYDARFGRELSLAVLSGLGRDYAAGRTVLFPDPATLELKVRPSKTVYRPGERVAVSLEASASGSPVEVAFGIAVIDQGVVEREATDRAGAAHRWFATYAREKRVAGYSVDELRALDPAKIDPDLQLVAEALLEPAVVTPDDDDFLSDVRRAYGEAAAKNLESVRALLDADYMRTLAPPTDGAALERILGLQLARVNDPWMRSYRPEFALEGANYVLRFRSAGPDKTFDTEDDLTGLTIRRDWFLPMKATIQRALDAASDFPLTLDEFYRALAGQGIDFAALRDPRGNPLRAEVQIMRDWVMFRVEAARTQVASFTGSHFRAATGRITRALSETAEFPRTDEQFRAVLRRAGLDPDRLVDPWGRRYYFRFGEVRHDVAGVRVYSYAEYRAGEVGREGPPRAGRRLTADVMSPGLDGIPGNGDDFSVATFERIVAEKAPPSVPDASAVPGGPARIEGMVYDASGAVIPNAMVSLAGQIVAHTGADGAFAFPNLAPGVYELRIESPGFRTNVLRDVPAQTDHITVVNLTLQVGSVSQSVTVEAAAPMLNTSSAMPLRGSASIPSFTPRVREYFPETLYWRPEVIGDVSGHAALEFKMADSITEWRVSVIASTLDGRVAERSASIRSFLPLFVDADPPRTLTAGDEVALPVPVRNYRKDAQAVTVTAAAGAALAVKVESARLRIGPNESGTALVRLRAAAPGDARLTVAARGKDRGDAAAKPIAVHPYGMPVIHTAGGVLDGRSTLTLEAPANAIAGSLRGEVKIYPTLLSRVLETAGSLLEKPHGCGEQTISSTYPNLLLLSMMKAAGLRDEAREAQARRNLEAGYRRLLGYQTPGAGFAYWHGQAADPALTAYALEFLAEASAFLEVDKNVTGTARNWLAANAGGSFAARALALRALGEDALPALFDALGRDLAAHPEPYPLAVFALAAMERGRVEDARSAIAALREAARTSDGAAWWPSLDRTPFYGWGRAGEVETTALAVRALAAWRRIEPGDTALDSTVNAGALYLLRAQDSYGGWWSTQATIRGLQALIAAVVARVPESAAAIAVRVNGAVAGTIHVAAGE
ncbi:MAG: carboxypeptidase regulatory-like domain-containing protein, partial [Acidobacteria bacterium]|nr:carboxypeptidase regulatory-like domain-containing protein [Acidobacteriota bacterium]